MTTARSPVPEDGLSLPVNSIVWRYHEDYNVAGLGWRMDPKGGGADSGLMDIEE
jgi:hypothetical protein